MALETGTTIAELNASNPPASDGLGQADDHFRLIKTVLKSTFPNFVGALTATEAAIDAAVARVTNGVAALRATGSYFEDDSNTGLSHPAADQVALKAGGTDRATATSAGLTVTGTLTPSGQVIAAVGTVAAPGVTFLGDLDCGLYRIGANNIGIAVGGVKRLDISSTGLAVTGTLTPTTLGACALSGTYTGNHTYSGNVTVSGTLTTSGGGTITGTYGGAHTYSGVCTFSAAGVPIVSTVTAKAKAHLIDAGASVTVSAGAVNIASATDDGSGIYSVVFTNALADALYVAIVQTRNDSGARQATITTQSTTGFSFRVGSGDGDATSNSVGFNVLVI